MEGLRFSVSTAESPCSIRIGRQAVDKKRGVKNQLVLPMGVGISSSHAEIRVVDGKIVLRDVGSTNGTFVALSRVTEEIEVTSGEVFLAGFTPIRVAFEDEPHPDLPPVRTLAPSPWEPLQTIILSAKDAAERLGETYIDTRHLCDAVLRSQGEWIKKTLKTADWSVNDALTELWQGTFLEGTHAWLSNVAARPIKTPEASKDFLVSPKAGGILDSVAEHRNRDPRREVLKELLKAANGPVGIWLAAHGVKMDADDISRAFKPSTRTMSGIRGSGRLVVVDAPEAAKPAEPAVEKKPGKSLPHAAATSHLPPVRYEQEEASEEATYVRRDSPYDRPERPAGGPPRIVERERGPERAPEKPAPRPEKPVERPPERTERERFGERQPERAERADRAERVDRADRDRLGERQPERVDREREREAEPPLHRKAERRPSPDALAPLDVVVDQKARDLAQELAEVATAYRFSTAADRRLAIRGRISKELHSVAVDRRPRMLEQVRIQFPILDPGEPPKPASDPKEVAALKERIRQLESELDDARRQAKPAPARAAKAVPSAIPWEDILEKGSVGGLQAATLREIIEFAVTMERFLVGMVESSISPTGGTQMFRLPDYKENVQLFLTLIKEGTDRDLQQVRVKEYLMELQRWQVAMLAAQHEAPKEWFAKLWKRINPTVIEQTTREAGWKLRSEAADWWNLYKNAVKDLNPDVVQDQILQAVARISQEEQLKLKKGTTTDG